MANDAASEQDPGGPDMPSVGFRYPEWQEAVTPDFQARKLACCGVDAALHGERADPTFFAMAAIMAARKAGLSLNGSVHMTQRYDLGRPVALGEPLVVKGAVTERVPHPRGSVEWSVFEFVDAAGETPLVASRQSLKVDRSAQTGPAGRAAGKDDDPVAGMTRISEKQLEPDKVVEFTVEAGNLIHSDPRVARSFGFRAPIVGGLFASHVMMEALAADGPIAGLDMEVRFARPMFWDEALVLWGRRRDGEWRDLVLLNAGGRPASLGRVERVAR